MYVSSISLAEWQRTTLRLPVMKTCSEKTQVQQLNVVATKQQRKSPQNIIRITNQLVFPCFLHVFHRPKPVYVRPRTNAYDQYEAWLC